MKRKPSSQLEEVFRMKVNSSSRWEMVFWEKKIVLPIGKPFSRLQEIRRNTLQQFLEQILTPFLRFSSSFPKERGIYAASAWPIQTRDSSDSIPSQRAKARAPVTEQLHRSGLGTARNIKAAGPFSFKIHTGKDKQ
jgi:hypothetical protein